MAIGMTPQAVLTCKPILLSRYYFGRNIRERLPRAKLLSREKDRQLFQNFTHHVRRGLRRKVDSSDAPVQALDLVG